MRAMEIIDELESSRKLYAGGIGYFTSNQDFDTCIALRTAMLQKMINFMSKLVLGLLQIANQIKNMKKQLIKQKL